MRIVVSLLNYRPGCIGGTETYLQQIVPAMGQVLAADDSGDELAVLCMKHHVEHISFPKNVSVHCVPYTDRQMVLRRSAEALGLFRDRAIEKTINAMKPDVMLFPQQSVYPLRVKVPTVLVVHDLLHLVMPETLGIADRVFRGLLYRKSIAASEHVIAISRETANRLVQHMHVSPEKINVVHHGYAARSAQVLPEDLSQREQLMLAEMGRGFLYYPAATHPHKNHITLIQTLAKLKAAGRWGGRLILSGVQTQYWKKIQHVIAQHHMQDYVTHVGFVSYEMVLCLYQRASAVVFASTHEGFGIPIIEAVMAGCKLVTSRLAIYEEIGVPKRAMIDFADAQALAEALGDTMPTTLEQQPITWQDAAHQTLDVLRRTRVLSCHD